MFDMSLCSLSNRLLKDVINTYQQLNVKYEPLKIIKPQFEIPLPALQLAVCFLNALILFKTQFNWLEVYNYKKLLIIYTIFDFRLFRRFLVNPLHHLWNSTIWMRYSVRRVLSWQIWLANVYRLYNRPRTPANHQISKNWKIT